LSSLRKLTGRGRGRAKTEGEAYHLGDSGLPLLLGNTRGGLGLLLERFGSTLVVDQGNVIPGSRNGVMREGEVVLCVRYIIRPDEITEVEREGISGLVGTADDGGDVLYGGCTYAHCIGPKTTLLGPVSQQE
jgi:hypothetical protein